MTPIITFTTGCGGATIERLETRPGCMAAMAEIPSNRRCWVLPAALVVVGVLMMVIGSIRQDDYASAVWLQLGSALALFGRCLGPGGCWSGDHRASPPALGCEISTSR
jgi:hypothetical protein